MTVEGGRWFKKVFTDSPLEAISHSLLAAPCNLLPAGHLILVVSLHVLKRDLVALPPVR